MKHLTLDNLITITIALICLTISNTITCLLWQHQVVLHNAAEFKADSWGFTHFSWKEKNQIVLQ